VCPAGEKCPYGGNTQKHIAGWEEKIVAHEDEIEKYLTLYKKWEADMAQLPAAIDKDKILKEIRSIEAEINEQKNSLRQVAFVKMELESLASIEAEIVELNKSLEEKGKQIETLRKERIVDLACLDAERVKLVDHELYQMIMSEKLANEKLTRATVALETLKRDTAQYNLGTDRQIALEKEMNILKDNVRKLQLVKDAFGSKGGIQTIIIDYVLPRLEEKINVILGKLSDFKVRLDTQKATADGDGVVEGLWITIVNEVGQEMSYENYSGGEKVRISIAIAEALASLSKKVGFRLLDEAVMSLSAEMTEQFVEVLGEMLNQYPQILAISHLPEVQEVFDHQLKVHKNNGVSHVE
jgi:exonuclease SbcC